MKRGYLPLYRKIQDHQFYKEKRVFSKYEAWIDVLMEVRQKLEPKEVLFGMTIIICNHGQSLYSLRTWGKRWGWSGKKVSRYFILLEKLKQISVENVTVTTRITVLNYKIYDVKCHADVTQATHEGNSTDTRPTRDCPTNKNVKKEKNEKNVKKNTSGKKFQKPTLEDVKAYCLERNNSVDADSFINHYESNGWKVGKNSMKCWKSAVRTWEKNNFKSGNGKQKTFDDFVNEGFQKNKEKIYVG